MVRTILITGATGYLGLKFVQSIIQEGYTICVLKRDSSNISNLKALSDNIKFYPSDDAGIDSAFKENNVDLIIHFATLYGRKGENIFEIKEANLDFPLRLLHAAVGNKVKYFLNTGTSLPYLTNHYSLFKSQFSEWLNYFSSQIVTINLLLEHFYGPDDDDSKFVTAMIGKMKKNVPDIELTAGTQLRDFIFIDDVISAYRCVIGNISLFSGFTDVPLGSGETVSIRNLVEIIKESSKSQTRLLFGSIPMRKTELLCSNADISILQNLGWTPKFSLNEGIKKTIDSYKL